MSALEHACRVLLVEEMMTFLKLDKRIEAPNIYENIVKGKYIHYVEYLNEVERVRISLLEMDINQNSVFIMNNHLDLNERKIILKDVQRFFVNSKTFFKAPEFLGLYLKSLNLNHTQIREYESEVEDVSQIIHAAVAGVLFSIGNDKYLDEKELVYLQEALSPLYEMLNQAKIRDFSIKSFLESHYYSAKDLNEIKHSLVEMIKIDGRTSFQEKSTVKRMYQQLKRGGHFKGSVNESLPLLYTIISFSDGELHEEELNLLKSSLPLNYFKKLDKAVLLVDLLVTFPNIFKNHYEFFTSMLPDHQKELDQVCLYYLINEKYYTSKDQKNIQKKIKVVSNLCSLTTREVIADLSNVNVLPEELFVFCCHFFNRERLRDNRLLKVSVTYLKRLLSSLPQSTSFLTYDLIVKIIISDHKISKEEYDCLHSLFENLKLDHLKIRRAFYRLQINEGPEDYSNYEDYERYERSEKSAS